ncbi:precorrin-2 dehydrogenase/sirohydrochlorin ferrochelatase family protein [Paenibacillus wynnii]|uniref:precorrin-2 dehydrogenase n=1 Tax=Paenibacillus wynnii TaxID=268407 RepID=A0A098M8E5_9BACL|nr:NAD(P)-dependent oxidoreductase [Paenibacillus wynnii]KGE18318.1 siroheme synthase [Paenibacillus wynnii]
MTVYLPIMLDCHGQRCVVIGGGRIAERKVLGLLEAGASVTVVSPSITDGLAKLAEESALTWSKRVYAPGDIRGAFLVYAASNDVEVNRKVAEEAHAYGIPVNVASEAERGSFITPGVVRRGRLTVAVSTSGAGPGAAAEIRGLLEETLGEEYGPYLEFLHHMRTEIKQREESHEVRSRLLRKLGTLDVLNKIRQGTFIEWSPEAVEAWIAHHREE